MVELTQENLMLQKAALDKIIRKLTGLTDTTEDAILEFCREAQLDNREHATKVAGHLHKALGELFMARCEAGKLDGGGLTRAGGS